LIDVVGRAEGLGRPLLYGTTPLFLEHFALRHLEELPRADELAIALRAQAKSNDDAAAPAGQASE
jgi:segregation and condensation protein B